MTTDQLAAVQDAEADIRWRNWQARGAAQDRRQIKTMGGLALLVGAGLALWLFVQLV